jgi:YggT family protein
VGDVLAGIAVLGDAQTSVQRFVDVFITVYALLLFAYIILTWVRLPYSPTMERVERFLADICVPYLGLFRRFIPPIGPLDVSPILAFLALYVIHRLLDALIARIL